jgi:peptide/nickel transport system substrate-binding protein
MHRLSDRATVPGMRRTLLLLSTLFALTTAASAADLRLGIAVEPDSIDPHYHNFGGNKGLMPNIFRRAHLD